MVANRPPPVATRPNVSGLLDETDLRRLTDALAIPPAKCCKAETMLKQMVHAVLDAHERDKFIKTTFDPKADRAALKRISEAAHKLSAAIEICTDGACYHLDAVWPQDGTSPDEIFAALDTLKNVKGKPGKAGHPRSPMAFRSLVGWLNGIANECGGRASIDAKQQSGRIVDALEILRKRLPKGVVPNALPCGTIARFKDQHSAISRRLAIKNGTKITRL